jgi:hypothetical protein
LSPKLKAPTASLRVLGTLIKGKTLRALVEGVPSSTKGVIYWYANGRKLAWSGSSLKLAKGLVGKNIKAVYVGKRSGKPDIKLTVSLGKLL